MHSPTLLLFLAAAALAGGCASSDKPSNMRARQEAALRDPFSYSPGADDRTDVSGGGMTDFKSDAFKKDLNSVFSP